MAEVTGLLSAIGDKQSPANVADIGDMHIDSAADMNLSWQ